MMAENWPPSAAVMAAPCAHLHFSMQHVLLECFAWCDSCWQKDGALNWAKVRKRHAGQLCVKIGTGMPAGYDTSHTTYRLLATRGTVEGRHVCKRQHGGKGECTLGTAFHVSRKEIGGNTEATRSPITKKSQLMLMPM